MSAYSHTRCGCRLPVVLSAISAFDAGDRTHEATLNAIEALYAVGPDVPESEITALAEPLSPIVVPAPKVKNAPADRTDDAAE